MIKCQLIEVADDRATIIVPHKDGHGGDVKSVRYDNINYLSRYLFFGNKTYDFR